MPKFNEKKQSCRKINEFKAGSVLVCFIPDPFLEVSVIYFYPMDSSDQHQHIFKEYLQPVLSLKASKEIRW